MSNENMRDPRIQQDQRKRQAQELRAKRTETSAAAGDTSPSATTAAAPATAQPKARGKLFAGVAAAVCIAAVGFAALGGLFGGGDSITDAESQARQTGYEALVAGGGMKVDMVSYDDVDSAIDTMSDDPAVKEEIQTAVSTGEIQLAWLTLWDTHAEDGDILRFEAAGVVPVEVMAMNAKTTIAIPYPADGNVTVTGVRDGGGGITIALESGATQIAWPTMQTGQSINLPVTPGY
ncbi:MAG: hypothetical protein AAGJ09_01530 [Pseudomonadota bacterium]